MLRANFLKAILKPRIFLLFVFVTASANASDPLIYMRPNETPLFTELYPRYGLLNPPAVHVFDSSVYLGQPGEKSLLIPTRF
ncbi:hypothetical protein FOLKNPGA_00538 [Legionella sp. PC1000]|nr:hypothetical protein FOLKNPGA_00538 [Legionella sp. PC1000]